MTETNESAEIADKVSNTAEVANNAFGMKMGRHCSYGRCRPDHCLGWI